MKIVHISEFDVHGISTRTCNDDEMHASSARIGALWGAFAHQVMPHARAQAQVFGVYHQYASDAHGAYTVTAGIDAWAGVAPSGSQIVKVQGGRYMVFESSGAMPQAVIAAWGQVWDFFAQENCPYQRAYSTDFERYEGVDVVRVFIALKELP